MTVRPATIAWLLTLSPLTSAAPVRSPGPVAEPPATWAFRFKNVGGLVVLAARLNNGPARRFILDTGARPCVIDTSVARSQGISHGRAVDGIGGGGSFRAVEALGAGITIEGRPVRCNGVWLADLNSVGSAIGARIDGVIGSGFFENATVTIDYRTSQVVVAPASWAAYRGRGVRIPIAVKGGRPYLTALLKVAGQPEKKSELLIDTGSQDIVDDSVLALAPGGPASSSLSTSGLGPGGKTVGGTFDEVRIGKLTFRNLAGVVPTVPIVGAGLLKRFRVILNYSAGWMALERY